MTITAKFFKTLESKNPDKITSDLNELCNCIAVFAATYPQTEQEKRHFLQETMQIIEEKIKAIQDQNIKTAQFEA